MTPTSGHIARVIEELEAEREHLTARLTKVDAAVATMRDLFHLPGEKPAKPQTRAHAHEKVAHAKVNGRVVADHTVDTTQDAIREALKAGPMTPAALEAKLKISRYMLTSRVTQLEAAGIVVATGHTGSRSIALASAPKEAPQR